MTTAILAITESLRQIRRRLGIRRELRHWWARGFVAPAPQFVKWATLERYATPKATWVETGTYLGETTDFLARRSAMVYSLEPSDELYAICQKRFLNRENIRLLHGTSEVIFPDLVRDLRGDIRFWLDGHASGGVTFQGKLATPVLEELRAIEQAMSHYSSTVVLIDDMRCFEPQNPEFADYPSRDELVAWAVRNSFVWNIEHDVFIARRK